MRRSNYFLGMRLLSSAGVREDICLPADQLTSLIALFAALDPTLGERGRDQSRGDVDAPRDRMYPFTGHKETLRSGTHFDKEFGAIITKKVTICRASADKVCRAGGSKTSEGETFIFCRLTLYPAAHRATSSCRLLSSWTLWHKQPTGWTISASLPSRFNSTLVASWTRCCLRRQKTATQRLCCLQWAAVPFATHPNKWRRFSVMSFPDFTMSSTLWSLPSWM